MSKTKVVIDDGFNPEWVEMAFFDGILEMPIVEKPSRIIIPQMLIPYSQRARSKDHSEFIAFYEHDVNFGEILKDPVLCIKNVRPFAGAISPDCSLYRDVPLIAQIGNTFRNRAIGHQLQKNGIYVVTNIRWGDERSYTTDFLPEKFAFLGAPKNSIVSIGSYGCIKTAEDKFYFREGLEAMLDELKPQVVLVYGSMPKKIFGGLESLTEFIRYPDWISFVKRVKAAKQKP